MVEKFENKLKKLVGSKYAVVNSATNGLHLACMSLNLKKGDIVWTSINTFGFRKLCCYMELRLILWILIWKIIIY